MLRRHSFAYLVIFFSCISSPTWAVDDDFGTPVDTNDAAIEEQINDASESSSNISNKVKRLENQIENPSSTQLLQRINQLQEQIQQLEGKLEEQQHDIKRLREQLQESYADLEQRITKVATDSSNLGDSKNNSLFQKSNDGNTSSAQNSDDKTAKTTVSDNLQNSETKSGDEEARYLEAYKLVKSNNFEKALPLMQSFIKDFPKSHYAANAHYWIGEILIYQGNQEEAKKEFTALIQQFPKSTKIADARLKLANIYISQGLIEQARKELATVQKEFPDSPAARTAKDRLKDIAE